MPLAPGTRVGVYEIEAAIGRGGMGEVYRARDTRLDRVVAIKILPAEWAVESARRERFEREARVTSGLNHPNLVVLHDIGQHDGLHFIVMEHVDGETLATRLGGGPLLPAVAAQFAAQIADGLASAHAAGIIHRDLKPANVMIGPDQRVKLLDFGLGKLVDARSQDPTLTSFTTGHDTQPGEIIGTPAYMSPEQALGRPAEAASDQFALGLILYEMLTGRHAFGRASGVQTMNAIIEAEPRPLSESGALVPPALGHVIRRCLAKAPSERFASTTDLARALHDVVDDYRGSRITAVAAPVARRRWRIAALVTLAVMVVAVPGWRWMAPDLAAGSREVAVLPLLNLDGDAPNQALADGLAEVLSARLAQLERFDDGLRVVPANEVRRQNVTSARDARMSFGVTAVVQGSLRRSGDGLQLTLNLTDTSSLQLLAADTIELPTRDARALQDEVVGRVMRLLRLELTDEARTVVSDGNTRAPGAAEFYLQGRGYLQRYERPENVDAAIALFERSVGLDANYGLAHAALAEAYWRRYELTKDAAWAVRAQTSGATALRLSPTLVQVRVTLGMIAIGTGQYEAAVGELTAALRQDPASADAHRELGRAYEAMGDHARAESTLKAAITARPADWSMYNALGALYARLRRYDEAATQFERVVALTPDNARGHSNLGAMYTQLRDWPKAFAALEKATALGPNDRTWSNLATAYFRQGRYQDAAAAFERAISLGATNYQVWANLASAWYWVPGREARSLEAYARAAELGEAERRVNPRQPALLGRLAECYAHLNNRRLAESLAAEAEALAPKDARVWLQTAQAFEQLGDRAGALRRVEMSLKLGLSREEVESSRTLEALRKDPAYASLQP